MHERKFVHRSRFLKDLARADLARWEKRFDSALRPPKSREVTIIQEAWDALIKHGCDPRVLKSALYHAADYAFTAEEFPRMMTVFFRGRKSILGHIARLREQLDELTLLRCGSLSVAAFIWELYRLRREHVSFLRMFPKHLERLSKILVIPRALSLKLYGKKSSGFVVTGEAALHVYVQETTRKQFTSNVAVLLEAAGRAYGLESEFNYSEEAVRKRYRRFRQGSTLEYRLIRRLVRTFISNAQRGNFHLFINSEYFKRGYDVAMDHLEEQPYGERVRNWGKLVSSLDASQ